jgi:hypothetical protein
VIRPDVGLNARAQVRFGPHRDQKADIAAHRIGAKS